MEDEEYTWYQEGSMLVGWLNAYPDYPAQGKDLVELQKNLKAMEDDIESFRDVLRIEKGPK